MYNTKLVFELTKKNILIRDLSLQSIQYLVILILTNNALVIKLLVANNLDFIFNIVSLIIDSKVINIDSWISNNKILFLLDKINTLDFFDLVAS